MNIPEIKFGKLIYKEHEGKNTYVYSYGDIEHSDFSGYGTELSCAGYILEKSYEIADNKFMLFEKDGGMVLTSYYPAIKQLRIVTELNSSYWTFDDEMCAEKVQPLITQINLEDHGLSYLVRLCDGRFIIFDGGWEFEVDADKLIDAMREQSPHKKPIVAAWIMTHPHIDHYRCYLAFDKKYSDEVEIQKFIYNFPDTDDKSFERMPGLKNEIECLNRFEEAVQKSKAPVYRAHTGQIFDIGAAKLEVLSSPDDTFFVPMQDLNPMSLIIRMEIEGQTILWCADGYFEPASLAERWGKYLKSDILQVPHHGFCGGDERTYDLIDPHTCIVPVEEICQAQINIYHSRNRHLIYNLNVQDFYTSTKGNLTLKLPHSPRTNGRKILLDNVEKYEKSFGAKSWFFDDMTDKDCDFTIINCLGVDASILVDLYFEDINNMVKSIKVIAPSYRVSKKNLLNPNDANPDAFPFNRASLKKLGLPNDTKFTVHFKSDVPVIIKGAKEPVYYA